MLTHFAGPHLGPKSGPMGSSLFCKPMQFAPKAGQQWIQQTQTREARMACPPPASPAGLVQVQLLFSSAHSRTTNPICMASFPHGCMPPVRPATTSSRSTPMHMPKSVPLHACGRLHVRLCLLTPAACPQAPRPRDLLRCCTPPMLHIAPATTVGQPHAPRGLTPVTTVATAPQSRRLRPSMATSC